jgi:dihydropyrimidinase/dihydroorotase
MSNQNLAPQRADLVVVGGTVVTPTGAIKATVVVRDGRIAGVIEPWLEPPAAERIDATGLVVLPGIVDPETHLGGNNSLLEDLRTETRAAAAGGVTTWGLQLTSANIMATKRLEKTPADLVPFSVRTPELIEMGDEVSAIDYFLTGIVNTDAEAEDIPTAARDWGVTSYKFYLHSQNAQALRHSGWYAASRHGFFGFDDGTVYLAMEAVASLGQPSIVSLHCENYQIARVFQDRLQAAGRTDMAAWTERSPNFLEAGHLRAYAYYAGVVGCPIYLQHTTTPEALDEIRRCKADGIRAFTQSAPHYLTLDPSFWKINVPLRGDAERARLWEALASGEIDALGSDHVNPGVPRSELDNGADVWTARSGFASRVEGALPMMLSEGVNRGRLSLERLAEVMSANPARIFGLYPRKGAIQVGSDADMVLVDPQRTHVVSDDDVISASGWTMYAGRTFTGWPVRTILRGQTVAEWPEGAPKPIVTDQPSGRYQRRVLAADQTEVSSNG